MRENDVGAEAGDDVSTGVTGADDARAGVAVTLLSSSSMPPQYSSSYMW